MACWSWPGSRCLDKVAADTFVVAAQNDHIVPWRSAYRATQLLAGEVEFVLTSSGHIAGVVNRPSPKSKHWVGSHVGEHPTSSGEWLRGAQQRRGSWRQAWTGWAGERGGPQRPPPPLGSSTYPAGVRPRARTCTTSPDTPSRRAA